MSDRADNLGLVESTPESLQERCQRLQREIRRMGRQMEAVERAAAEKVAVAERNRQMMYRTHEMLEAEIEVRKRSEEALREAMERATVAARTKDAFLRNMSHELRTPLNGVIGLLDESVEVAPDPAQRGRLAEARREALRLLTLVDDILTLSDAGTDGTPAETPWAPRGLLEELVGGFATAAEGAGLALETEVRPGVPAMVRGDATRLRQILRLVVGNAVKFTEQGGVRVVMEHGPGGLTVCVEDTGPGIPEDQLDSVFEAFFQVDNSATRSFEGAGLGLSIARRLAREADGALSLNSTVGRGTCVRLVLPVSLARDPSEPEAELPPGLRILVVDDNALNRKVAAAQLQRLGQACDEVEDGAEAVRAVTGSPYDVVLMDCQMPVLDGYEATRRIRTLEIAQPAIVALTAHVSAADRQACTDAGMDAFLSKPVDLQTLRRTLAVVVAAGRA